MGQALNHLAELLTGVAGVNGLDVDWSLVRYQHTAALRSRLQEYYQPRTVTKTLSALRGVLKEAWKLEQLAGHERLETTLQYNRRSEEVKRAAVEHLHVPYFEQNSSK